MSRPLRMPSARVSFRSVRRSKGEVGAGARPLSLDQIAEATGSASNGAAHGESGRSGKLLSATAQRQQGSGQTWALPKSRCPLGRRAKR